MENVVFVYSESQNENINISFIYESKELEFNRPKTDALEKTVQRIKLKLQPKKKKKSKSQTKCDIQEESSIHVEVYGEEGSIESAEMTNELFFQECNFLRINSTVYTIKVNLPKVKQITLLDPLMVGFPIFPIIELLFAAKEHCVFKWFRSKDGKESWEVVAETFVYTPQAADLAYYLKGTCVAGSKELKSPICSEIISRNPVAANPGVCPFDTRHLFTPKYLERVDEFRVVSYNILADVFAETDFGKNVLYPYCPPYALSFKYRVQLLLKELLGYHADIIALQECERKILEKYLMPILKESGYSSFLRLKIGEMPEGEGIIYRTNKFSMISDFTMSVREIMKLECNKYIMKIVEQIPDIYETLSKTITIAQMVLFKYISTEPHRLLCIVNTHLYYKAYYDDIRVLQAALILNYVHEKLSPIDDDVSLLLLGDLNIAVGKPGLDYLNGIEIKSDHYVWKRSTSELVNLLPTLKCPFKLTNFSGVQYYSHYVSHYQNTLDYIFGDSKTLSCSNVVPLPEQSELAAYIALPSVVAPSDHIPVITDLQWTGYSP